MSPDNPDARPVNFLKKEFFSSLGSQDPKPALIILNQPIADVEILTRLWQSTKYRVCADGGANQLYDLFKADRLASRDQFLPSIIHGDLDSLRDDVRDYYLGQGVNVTQDPDQYSTDFGKAIKQIIREQQVARDIIVLGTIAGRVDQGIGLLAEIYREQHSERHSGLRFWLFSESSISFILMKGRTVIHTALSEQVLTQNIGILPIYGPANITTEGLEWDVENWPTSMGGQVSTSNHIVRDQITVTTDAEVLFTVERNRKIAG